MRKALVLNPSASHGTERETRHPPMSEAHAGEQPAADRGYLADITIAR